MADRSVDEVIAYLRSWQPEDDSGWHFGPSVEGLGRVFAGEVKQRAREYAEIADNVRDLDPTYVRNFFSGLESALREGDMFRWGAPLSLAEFVASQPLEADEEVPDRDRDPGWRWCRREIASFLRTGFADRDNRLPFANREEAWRVVERLTSDPNPSPEHEQRYGGDNTDPFTLSINTNRGTAMHAVVEYALWTRRELEASGEDVSVGFEAMPEVRRVLDDHLSPASDPSLAIHAVYGRWLPWLLLLDAEWVAERLAGLFPTDEDLAPYRDVVWGTYVSWCPPYDSAFRSLLAEYQAAVSRVPSRELAGAIRRGNVDAKLGEHLVTFFWRGVADTSIINEFFRRAGDEAGKQRHGVRGSGIA